MSSCRDTPAPAAHGKPLHRYWQDWSSTGSLEEAQVHVAFFQETRAKTSSSCNGRWLRFCAAAERGRGGCAMWISKAWKIGDRPIDRNACTVLLAKADLLIIRLKFDGCSLLLVNLHAPHSQHSPEDIAAWRESTGSVLLGPFSKAIV